LTPRPHEFSREGEATLDIRQKTSAAIIKENVRSAMTHYKNILRFALATACILLLPLLAGAPWSLGDFVVAGVLLFGTGVTYELVATKEGTIAYRAAVGIACAAALLLVWINLAVGIIGSEDNPANLLYAGVLAVGLLGAIIARLEPRGMARALFAMALAQALVPVIALFVSRPAISLEPPGVAGVFALNAFFVALWVASALLFLRAAHAEAPIT
jgi:hypothetical protein